MDLDKSGLFSKMFDRVQAYTAFTRGEPTGRTDMSEPLVPLSFICNGVNERITE